jgi:hypothetical protein
MGGVATGCINYVSHGWLCTSSRHPADFHYYCMTTTVIVASRLWPSLLPRDDHNAALDCTWWPSEASMDLVRSSRLWPWRISAAFWILSRRGASTYITGFCCRPGGNIWIGKLYIGSGVVCIDFSSHQPRVILLRQNDRRKGESAGPAHRSPDGADYYGMSAPASHQLSQTQFVLTTCSAYLVKCLEPVVVPPQRYVFTV